MQATAKSRLTLFRPPVRLAEQFTLHGALVVVVGLALAWLVLPPLLFVVQTSLTDVRSGAFTLQNFATIFATGSNATSLLANSLIFSAGSSAIALVMGTLLAWLAERTNTPFRGVAYISAFVSFAIPGIVKVIGWILLLGPRAGLINVWLRDLLGLEQPPFNIFSMGGMILVEGLLWTPIVFLLMVTPFRSMDPSLEESAATSGAGIWQTFRRVTLRLAMPSVLAVLLLTFVRSLEAFEIPALIGIPAGISVFTTEVYLQSKSGIMPRYGEACAYAVLLIVLVASALYPYYLATRESQKFATITGKGFRPHVLDLGRWRLLTGVVMLVLPSLVVLPLLVLFWASLLPYFQPPSAQAFASLTLNNYPAAFANTNVSNAVSNSLTVSVTSATGTVLLTVLAAWLVVRTRIRGRWVLDQLATLPLVFPGVVMGIAVLRTYLTVPIPIYGTIWILVVAFMGRYLPYGMRYCYSGVLGVHRELDESAQLSGASWWTTLRRIVVPLMMPAIFASWIYVFLITVRELSVALLLYSPGSQIISVTIWELWSNGQVTELSAFSLVVTLGVVTLAVLFHRMSERYGYKV